MTLKFLNNLPRCLSACEKDKFDVILGHGDEGDEEGEVLLTFTINDRFYSEEEQGGLVHYYFISECTYIVLLFLIS